MTSRKVNNNFIKYGLKQILKILNFFLLELFQINLNRKKKTENNC